MNTADAPKDARRIAWQLRQEFRERGEFKQADFREALSHALADLADLADGSLMALVDETADEVDRESLADTPDDQLDPDGVDMEGEYRLGDGRRVAKRMATRDHMQEALRLDDDRLRDLQRAMLRKWQGLLAIGDLDPETN
jgi:hypothetical protein